MACGVTKVENGVTVTCDNAGTSAHAGNHSGLLTQSTTVFGVTYAWTSQRVYWKTGATTTARQKAATLGESDFA